MSKTFVSATRKWGQLPVTLTVYNQSEGEYVIKNSMLLEDFMDAILKEVGSVTYVITKEEFKKRLLAAKDTVVKEMAESVTPYGGKIPADI